MPGSGSIWSRDVVTGTITATSITADDLEVDVTTLVVDETNDRVGIGTAAPGTTLQVEGTAPYVTLKNDTAENSAGGCESKLIFEDHANVSLGQIEVSHNGSSNDTKGKMILSAHSGSSLLSSIEIVEGNVTKIGQDSPSSADVLTYDGAKWVAEAPTAGDITGVTAGDGLSGGGNTGGVTLALDLNELSAAAVAVANDSIAIIDADDDGSKKESIADLVTAIAGTAASTGLSASSGVLSVSDLHPVGVSGAANQLLTDDGDGTVTSEAKLLCDGATTTIGDGTAEDSYLKFDGNAVDFRIGIDDGTDTLEIGKGGAHGTTPAIKVDSNVNIQILHNSAVADGEFSGDLTIYQAGEDLTAGEVVYFKSDGKVWKAVATAAATSRAVAMCTASVSADAMGVFLLKGFARFNSEFPTWTIGGALFTPEAETNSKNVPEQAAPDSDGDFVQILGYAISGDAVYFNPDSTVVEVA